MLSQRRYLEQLRRLNVVKLECIYVLRTLIRSMDRVLQLHVTFMDKRFLIISNDRRQHSLMYFDDSYTRSTAMNFSIDMELFIT